jgi:predicted ribonuclease YlaK
LRVWTGEEFRYLSSKTINSKWFGKISPYSGDIYQKMLFDSLRNNKLTLVKGPAGSGKTFVSLAYLMAKIEAHELDKIIIFCNTVATANSARLGYYPGTKDEKLLDSQIGNLLSSKFGGREEVERLIAEGKLVLLPFSDIRGYDTSGMNAGIYISEAQNLDRTLMKLALQRVGEDCICIIDGDEKTQVDDIHFSGANNGMRRVSKVFRGKNIYGEVTLKNIYRSEIASIADKI